ncbi:MAG: WD40 repeat domain-containing protein, partial [Bdellovibrionota bacterium]
MMCAKRTEIDRLGFFIRLSLLILFVLAKPPVGFASEPEPSPRVSYEEFWNACSEEGCSIYPFEPKDWESRGENPRPPHADACDPYTYNAISLPPSLSGLPDFVALVGGEKKNFFIPITKDPEQVLEKGDILIYFKSTNPESKSLYEHVTKNRWHAAIIGEDSGGLFRLDSPSDMSGRNLRNGRYHIIRLRKYPPEIKTLSQLREWQADPEKMKILEEWEKRRQERLAEVNRMIQAMRRAGFGYDGARVTEVTKPNADLAKLKEELLAGRCPKLYCSELPAMAYALAGVKLPRASSLIDSINRLDERVIEPKLKALREEGKSEAELQAARAKMIDEGLRELFNDSTVLREFGASDAEMTAFRRDGSLPASIQPIMNQYRLVLSTPRFLRMRLAQGFEAVYGGDKGVMIGPSDFFDTITDPETEFSYVGSYVGSAYASRGQRGNAQMGAETAGGGGFQSLLASEPKSLWSEKLHQQRVNSVRFSPDGKKVLTASHDNTAKIFDLETGEEKTIQHGDTVWSASFSPDG